MGTGTAEAGIRQGAVRAWGDRERVSLGRAHPRRPQAPRLILPYLGTHGDSGRRTGQCPLPPSSGRHLGQHRGPNGRDLPTGTVHPPSLVGTCGQRQFNGGRKAPDIEIHTRQANEQTAINTLIYSCKYSLSTYYILSYRSATANTIKVVPPS